MFVNRHIKWQFKNIISLVFKKAKLTEHYIKTFANSLNKNEITKEGDSYEMQITDFLLNSILKINEDASSAMLLVTVFLNNAGINLDNSESQQFQQFFKHFFSSNALEEENIKNLITAPDQSFECFCNNQISVSSKQVQICYKCRQKCHSDCFWPRQAQDLFECPKCFLKNCIPEKPIKEILFLGYLKQSTRSKINHKIKFYTEKLNDKTSQIEIRCCRLNKENRFDLTFPQNCTIATLSGKKIMQFRPLWSNSPLKRRNDKQIVVEKYLLSYINNIVVQELNQQERDIKINPSDHHLIAIVETIPYQKEKIIKNYLSINNHISIQLSRQKLQNYINGKNNQIKIQKINVSMKCQYFNTYINQPIRSVHCNTHYQPFDLRSFVTINLNSKQSIQRWKCPICRKRSYDIIIDDYLCQILQKEKNPSEITFNNEGQLIYIQHEKRAQIDKENSSEEIQIRQKGIQKDEGSKAVDKIIQQVSLGDLKQKTINKNNAIQIIDSQEQIVDKKRKYQQDVGKTNGKNIIKKRLKLPQTNIKQINCQYGNSKNIIKNNNIISIDLQSPQSQININQPSHQGIIKKSLPQEENKQKQIQNSKDIPFNIHNNIKKVLSQRHQFLGTQKIHQSAFKKAPIQANSQGLKEMRQLKQKKLKQNEMNMLRKYLMDDDLLNGNYISQKRKMAEGMRLTSIKWITSIVSKPPEIS